MSLLNGSALVSSPHRFTPSCLERERILRFPAPLNLMSMTVCAMRELLRDSFALILAGGHGTRLGELTRWQCKPAIPFGGHFRNIDFTLSNCLNSGLRRIAVLTQYKAHGLLTHLQAGWSFLPRSAGEFVEAWPAQQRIHSGWYAGTADAVYQNIDLAARTAHFVTQSCWPAITFTRWTTRACWNSVVASGARGNAQLRSRADG